VSRVLVTGAGGFIGSHLVDDQLARGRTVLAFDVNLDRLSHVRDHPRCRLVQADLRDRASIRSALDGVEIVFHLASAHLEVNKSDSYFREVNVDAVRQLLTVAVQSGARRFVHCSSTGVFGALRQLPADESTECHPDVAYEVTKLAGERVVGEFRDHLPSVVIRPAWVYGPRCGRTLKLFRSIARRRFLMIGAGDNYRHPIYIDDMLAAFELAATREGIAGQTFIIASHQAVELKALIAEIVAVQGIDYRPARVPLAVMWPVCFAAEKLSGAVGREPPFSTRSLKVFTESASFRIDKARRLLGFEPHVALRAGLTSCFEHFRQQGLV
jgi:nucleoside-diphosphate-sugar epimerase